MYLQIYDSFHVPWVILQNGQPIIWEHFADLYKQDMELGLRRTRLSYEHIHLTPQSRMRVSLAAQVWMVIVLDSSALIITLITGTECHCCSCNETSRPSKFRSNSNICCSNWSLLWLHQWDYEDWLETRSMCIQVIDRSTLWGWSNKYVENYYQVVFCPVFGDNVLGVFDGMEAESCWLQEETWVDSLWSQQDVP